MKSLLLVPLLALSSTAFAAPEISVGVAGGAMVTDQLEVLGSTWYVTPRVGLGLDENLGLELDLGFQSGVTRIGDHPYTAMTPRLNLIGKLWNTGKRKADGSYGDPPPIHPILAAGIGGWYKSTNDGPSQPLGDQYIRKDFDFLANAGPGLMMPLGPLHLRTDLRWVLSLGNENFRNRGDQFISWEWTVGVGFTFGGKADKDKDGILDADDQCRDEPEDMDGFEDDDGCPDTDNDEDGILDADDQCKNEAEDDDDFEDDDGCPDTDNDKDEILDAEDSCPNEAGKASAKGCPDEDEDTVVDAEDECVDEKGSPDAFGCQDDDADHVPNYRDECPMEPGPSKADARLSSGCPSLVYVTSGAIVITEKVFFDTGKATIKDSSDALLHEVAATLAKHDNIKKVSIQGHTDNTGEAEANQTLSEARAASVMEHLIEEKVDASRLEAKGFGQTKPLADGDAADTDEGREKNRRVEFVIIEQEELKTVLKRPTFKLGKAKEDALDIAGLTPKNTPVPEAGLITQPTTCGATLVIDKEGKVTKVAIKECIGMARVATAKALGQWEFEPYEKDGKPTKIKTDFKIEFADGDAKISHKAKDITPLED